MRRLRSCCWDYEPRLCRRGCFLPNTEGHLVGWLSSSSSSEFYIGLMKPRGLYRERKGWGTQDSARVKYDEHQELDLSEATYRARDYQPPFDELPWKDEPANDDLPR